VSGVATLVLVTAPAIAVHGTEDGILGQVVPLPFVAMFGAVAIAVGLDVAISAREESDRALAELAAQRRNSDAIVSAVDVGLALLDIDGHPQQINQRQREIDALTYPLGREYDVVHVFDADGTTPLPSRELPSAMAARGLDFDDQRIWVGESPASRRALSVSARSVCDEQGRRTGSALVYQDVTELMRAMAVKDEFIGMVSHELRTPLTSIYGYVSILHERDDLPALVHKQLSVVVRSTDRLRLLVDDLLEAAQVASGGLSLDPGPIDLAPIVTEAIAAARPVAIDAGVALEWDCPASAPLVGDRVRLAQVVDNLLSNAIKYTPRDGTVRVVLEVGKQTVELRVQDTGMGIAQEDLGRVFTRFYRTKQASDRAIGGVGLGLSITRSIVEGHQGEISVASEVGRGSEFTVVLPAA
jgi:signal transduction histidine kinase